MSYLDEKGGTMDYPTFGRWLKLRRGGLGLTQAQLGEQSGLRRRDHSQSGGR